MLLHGQDNDRNVIIAVLLLLLVYLAPGGNTRFQESWNQCLKDLKSWAPARIVSHSQVTCHLVDEQAYFVLWQDLVKDICHLAAAIWHLAEAIWHYLMEYYLGLVLCVVVYLLFSMLKEIADITVIVAALNLSYRRERERERLLRDEMSNEEDLVVRLNQDYTHCAVCHEPFATDMESTVQETREMLPVFGSCGHYFCHGCILRLRTMVGLNGTVGCPKCMRGNQFVRENPTYHRLVIDLLERARPTANRRQ